MNDILRFENITLLLLFKMFVNSKYVIFLCIDVFEKMIMLYIMDMLKI